MYELILKLIGTVKGCRQTVGGKATEGQTPNSKTFREAAVTWSPWLGHKGRQTDGEEAGEAGLGHTGSRLSFDTMWRVHWLERGRSSVSCFT